MEEEELRLCPRCREEQPLGDFQKGRRVCRACSNAARVAWAHSDPATNRRALEIRARYVQRRKAAGGGHTEAEWAARLAAFGHRCVYCGQAHRALIKEHVVPVSWGGTQDAVNLVPACQPCNARKNDRPGHLPPPPAPQAWPEAPEWPWGFARPSPGGAEPQEGPP